MEFKELIGGFAASLGVKDLVFDDEAVVRLAVDDMTIAFMEIPERHSLLLWSNVATPPPEHLEQLYRVLLEASFMGRATNGAAFSIDNGDVYLHRIDALVELDVESLTAVVENFVNAVEAYRRIIVAFRADVSAKPSEDEAPVGGLGSIGFMQV